MGKVQLENGAREDFAHDALVRYIDGESGRRSDTAHYVYNQTENTNLTVLDRHRVVKVIFKYVNSIVILLRHHMPFLIR